MLSKNLVYYVLAVKPACVPEALLHLEKEEKTHRETDASSH